MKQVLLAVIIVACFSSAVSALALARVYVIVNMDDAPIEILEFGRYRGEDEDHIASVVEYKNRTDRTIEALAITMIYYDAFNEKQDGITGVSTDRLLADREDSSGWSTYGEPDFVKTAIAYVRAVRFIDGEVWKADTEKVIETAGDMPELSFLSRTEMLEIEKE